MPSVNIVVRKASSQHVWGRRRYSLLYLVAPTFNYTGVDPKHVGRKPYAPLCSHWAPQRFNGLGVTQAPKHKVLRCSHWAAQLDRMLQQPRSDAGCSSDPNIRTPHERYYDVPTGPLNLTVRFNSLGVAQAAPRTQTQA